MESRDSKLITELKKTVTAYQTHLDDGAEALKKLVPNRRGFSAQELFENEHNMPVAEMISFLDYNAATYLELKNLIVNALLESLTKGDSEPEKLKKFSALLAYWKPALESRRGRTGSYKDLLFVNEKQIIDNFLPDAIVPKGLKATGIQMVKQAESLIAASFIEIDNIFRNDHRAIVLERKSPEEYKLVFSTREDAMHFCQSYRHIVNPIFVDDKNDCSILTIGKDEYDLLAKKRSSTQNKKSFTQKDDVQKDLDLIRTLNEKLGDLKSKIAEDEDFIQDSSDANRKKLSSMIIDDGLRILNGQGCAKIKLKQFSDFFNKKQTYLERLQNDSVTAVLKTIAELILPRSMSAKLFKQKEAVKVIKEVDSELNPKTTSKK